MNNFEKVKNILKKNKINHKILPVSNVITDLGIESRLGLSTLIYKSGENSFVVILRRDDKKIDNEKLLDQLNLEDLTFCTDEDLKKLDLTSGSISPILFINIKEKGFSYKVIVDKSAFEMEKVYCGTGSPNHSLELNKLEDLLKIIGDYQVLDFTSDTSDKDISEQIVLSGITPSSSKGLHLGNYLGAAKQHVEMQKKAKQAYYFIADYHALNTVVDPEVFRSNVYNTYLDFLSFGLTPEKDNVMFYIQSGIPEIAELNLILNNVVTMGELNKMHAFKDKLQKGADTESINHGLFNYPVLMAADILIFNADVVPVGEDQKQHVEITRTIAKKFNNRYGEVMTVPDVYIKKETARVVGTDGERKMSKSLGNFIAVFDSQEEIKKQVFDIKTDPARIHPDDPGDPEKNPIFTYMRFLGFDKEKLADYESRYREGSVGDVEIKEDFYEFYLDYFKEMRDRRNDLARNEDEVRELIKKNNEEARIIAVETINKVRKAVGIDKL
jgi:tryptophanyl-tRNA synthetase